jgi:hypothetical protein
MNKAIITGIIFQLMIIPATFAMSDRQSSFEEDKNPKAITSIEINADVTVVLGQFGNKQAFMEGDAQFMQQVIINHVGHRLVISAVKNRNLKDKGVIYISAESLSELRINSSAYVQSSGALNVPMLEVLINGACQVVLANTGKLNFVPSVLYDFEYKTMETFRPIDFYRFRKK